VVRAGGCPLRYQAVAKLVGHLRARTGIEFTPHMLRHSRATELIRGGAPIEAVSKLLTHRTPAFLDIHRRQRGETRTLIATAETDGRFRLAANHRQVHDNLEQLIDPRSHRRHPMTTALAAAAHQRSHDTRCLPSKPSANSMPPAKQ
jgi:hypothetical protein